MTEIIYSVAVIGHLNPAIHHPMWYEAIGACDAEDARSALEDSVTTATQSEFTLRNSEVLLQCTKSVWKAKVDKADRVNRLLGITGSVWDKLDETPVSAFTLNFSFHRPTKASSAGKHIDELLHTLPMELPRATTSKGSIKTINKTDLAHERLLRRELTTTIEESVREESSLFVGLSFRHLISPREEDEHVKFDLSALVEEYYDSTRQEAEQLSDEVIATFNESL